MAYQVVSSALTIEVSPRCDGVDIIDAEVAPERCTWHRRHFEDWWVLQQVLTLVQHDLGLACTHTGKDHLVPDLTWHLGLLFAINGEDKFGPEHMVVEAERRRHQLHAD